MYQEPKKTINDSRAGRTTKTRGYAPVNGLKIYYQIEGSGDPILLSRPLSDLLGGNLFLSWFKTIP